MKRAGTRDRSSFCAIHDALAFRASLGGEQAINDYNHGLARRAGQALTALWNTSVLDAEESQANSMLNVVVPTSNRSACLEVVGELKREHGMYVNSCFQLDAAHGDVPNYFRLSAQVFLELSDFEALGKLVLQLLGERGALVAGPGRRGE